MADFSGTLRNLRAGQALYELDAKLTQAVKEAHDTGKATSLTLTLKLSPTGRQIVVTDEIKVKLPDPEKEKTILFANGAGELSRRNPDQKALPFKDVDDDTTEPKVVEDADKSSDKLKAIG